MLLIPGTRSLLLILLTWGSLGWSPGVDAFLLEQVAAPARVGPPTPGGTSSTYTSRGQRSGSG